MRILEENRYTLVVEAVDYRGSYNSRRQELGLDTELTRLNSVPETTDQLLDEFYQTNVLGFGILTSQTVRMFLLD